MGDDEAELGPDGSEGPTAPSEAAPTLRADPQRGAFRALGSTTGEPFVSRPAEPTEGPAEPATMFGEPGRLNDVSDGLTRLSSHTKAEGTVRIELADRVIVEVRTEGTAVHVAVEAPEGHLPDLRALAPELRAELAADGLQLGSYTTGQDRRQPSEPKEEGSLTPHRRGAPARPLRSSRRIGRYA